MKKRIVAILFWLSLIIPYIFAAPTNVRKDIQIQKIDSIEKICKDVQFAQKQTTEQLNSFQVLINSTQQICSTTISSTSTQIEASNKLLNIWGIILSIIALLITVAGSILGYYIKKRAKSVENLIEQGKKTEESIKSIQQQIDTDLRSIYIKLRREETLYVLNRLQQIPEDVSNYSSLLLSRELEPNDYGLLLKAYNKLLTIEQEIKKTEATRTEEDDMFASLYGLNSQYESYKSLYRILFFQHFINFAINEDIIKQDIIDNFKELCDSAFRNDIEKSTHDLLIGISNCESQMKIEILTKYIMALSTSKYNDKQLYNDILLNLNIEQIADIWLGVSSQNQSVVVFAQSIQEYIEGNQLEAKNLSEQIAIYISTHK